ncbi:hypothetical protein ACWPM1_12315 [Tsuneonella sp. HG249]
MNDSNTVRFRGFALLAIAAFCSSVVISGGIAIFELQGALIV